MNANEKHEKALKTFQIIAPLLESDLEAAEIRRRRAEILARYEISERTLRRYLKTYRDGGFESLMPKSRSDCGLCRAIDEPLLVEAMQLKEELPERSVSRIIQILEGEKLVPPGKIARSTLTRQLTAKGLTRQELMKDKTGHRRFQKEHRNQMWQTDVKFGPFIPNPNKPGRKMRTYLLVFLDDATRLICHGQFYLDQRLPILEDTFRKALLKRGVPASVYVDNGKIFVSKWFRMGCARLKIRHLNTQPYSPESKGKVERFNRTVEAFLSEISLDPPATLEELNRAFAVWVEEGYNHQPHSALGNISPAVRFQQDTKRLRFANPEELRDAFLWEKSCRVDKAGCFKLEGKVFEAGPQWTRKTIDVRYDPLDLSAVEVWHQGQRQSLAKTLVIPEWNTAYLKTETVHPKTRRESRYLKTLETKSQVRKERKLGAIAYRNLEGDDSSV
jgi:putative transposase